ncbi:squalene/phytoene synthase family protein [Streptomyces sp. NPDC057654]|uniref:squalene/phytoene synthase family protein n=1 Tax=Streptomyces sp. NPDC057654 TaxID=3346196 RepID=UPI00367D7172
MTVLDDAHTMIRTYSTTWYEPVMAMPPGLQEATACAYLLMRGIDEIEDHPDLDGPTKALLLERVARIWQTRYTPADFTAAFRGYEAVLPEVTLRLAQWSALAPPEIGPRVVETFIAMAERMADWARHDFTIRTRTDLDRYTYAVSGTLVLLLSDLWAWHDGTRADRTHAIGYGRALQTANILIDRGEDTGRGVDFWPTGWGAGQMTAYVQQDLVPADAYLAALPPGPARSFCAEPLAQAHQALARRGAVTTGHDLTPPQFSLLHRP